MTVRIYKSTDASAPVLTGQAGALITVLDAILVNGYGAKTAAGWTKPFSTTNKAAYLQNLTGANNATGMYLFVDDAAPTTAKEARVTGFETMSAITPTGTGQFPTNAQSSIGVGALVVRKSTTADATARAWTCIANGQTFMFFAESGDITGPPLAAFPFIFGDFTSYKAADSYAVVILGRQIENVGSSLNDHLQHIMPYTTHSMSLATVMFGHYIARHWTGVGGSKNCGHCVDMGVMPLNYNASFANSIGTFQVGSNATGAGAVAMGFQSPTQHFPYPNGPDSAVWLSPVRLIHDTAVRGHLRGLWAPMHHRPIGHADVYTIAGGNLNGKSMVAICIPVTNNAGSNDAGQVHVETSDTWS